MATKLGRKARPSIGPYTLHEPLGRGGQGAVYRGTDTRSGRGVAVKLLREKLGGSSTLQYRFAREFQAASTLDHPNIIRALDYGLDGQDAFLVMELIDGESLGDLIDRQGPLPEATAVRIVTLAAQALHHAHRQRIVHRDVKPDNILIRADGMVKLTDFGLAKELDSEFDLTKPASGLGTPHFMAPEQYENAKHARPASDVYALGATLYTALTGTLPFQAYTSLVALTKKLTEPPPSPRAANPAVSEPVDQAVRLALDPDPLRRPASALRFVRLLANPAVFKGKSKSAALRATVRDDDRRRADRRPLSLGTMVLTEEADAARGDEADEWPAVVRDQSSTGLGLLLARRFEPGTRLVVPLDRHPGRLSKRALVQVVRVVSDEYGHWFHGCVLLDPANPAGG